MSAPHLPYTHSGNLELLNQPLLALFCSRRCPGNVILRAYDLAVALRDRGVPVIGGFHTPVEREMLRVLLRGNASIVIVEARGQRVRLPQDWQAAHEAGRLLVLWPFPAGERRVTRALAEERNRLVASHARRVLFLHAAPGGETDRLARELAGTGTPLLTLALDDGANDNLLALGAVAVDASDISALLLPV